MLPYGGGFELTILSFFWSLWPGGLLRAFELALVVGPEVPFSEPDGLGSSWAALRLRLQRFGDWLATFDVLCTVRSLDGFADGLGCVRTTREADRQVSGSGGMMWISECPFPAGKVSTRPVFAAPTGREAHAGSDGTAVRRFSCLFAPLWVAVDEFHHWHIRRPGG